MISWLTFETTTTKTVDMQSNDTPRTEESNTVDMENSYTDLLRSIPSREPVRFTAREQDIVNLYDQLSDLRLECALLQAQQNKGRGEVYKVLPRVLAKSGLDHPAELSEEVAKSELRDAERECLEARSAYLLKNSAIEDILLAAPLLQAIHGSPNINSLDRLRTTTRLDLAHAYANPSTRVLHPLVADRDIVSMAHANLSAMYQSVMGTLTSTDTENVITVRLNQQLTTNLLGLTDQLKAQAFDEISDPELRQHLKKSQDDTRETKRRWRIMKSLVSAVIVGSGVDWAHNESLRNLVLDDED
ncbi:hypothetical protein MMC18_001967 [Xylographa bjoerkii]|nr:hypothetical protein [Xylographa bjoerkii]